MFQDTHCQEEHDTLLLLLEFSKKRKEKNAGSPLHLCS